MQLSIFSCFPKIKRCTSLMFLFTYIDIEKQIKKYISAYTIHWTPHSYCIHMLVTFTLRQNFVPISDDRMIIYWSILYFVLINGADISQTFSILYKIYSNTLFLTPGEQYPWWEWNFYTDFLANVEWNHSTNYGVKVWLDNF